MFEHLNNYTTDELKKFVKEAQAEIQNRYIKEFEKDKKELAQHIRNFIDKYPTAECPIEIEIPGEDCCECTDEDIFCHFHGHTPEQLAELITL